MILSRNYRKNLPVIGILSFLLSIIQSLPNPHTEFEKIDYGGQKIICSYTTYALKNFLWLKVSLKNNEQISLGNSVIWYFKNRSEGIMQSLYVKPIFRKQGMGTLLFISAAKKIKENGCSLLSGFPRAQEPKQDISDPDQEALIRFYQSFGAQPYAHGEYRLPLDF